MCTIQRTFFAVAAVLLALVAACLLAPAVAPGADLRAEEDRRARPALHPEGGKVAAKDAAVDDVVVQKAGRVYHFHRRRRIHQGLALGLARASEPPGQAGAKHFAAGEHVLRFAGHKSKRGGGHRGHHQAADVLEKGLRRFQLQRVHISSL